MTEPITESRLKGGTLTLGSAPGEAFETQATNVRLVPSTDEVGDPLEVLSGDTLDPEDETTWALVITAVQDFTDPAGFQNYALQNAGDIVAYTWKPNAVGPTYTGTVKVRPVEIGGDVNKRLTTDAEWPCQEVPTVAYPV